MKRKVAVVGLTFVTGLLQAAVAAGWDNDSVSSAPLALDRLESPGHAAEGSFYRLKGQPSIPQGLTQRNTVDAWQMEFVAPPSAYRSDDPLTANDKRVGVTFKLDF